MGAAQTNAGFFFSFDRMCRSPCAGNSQMNDDQQNTVLSKASVFGLPDEAPMTALHYYYWLLASGGTLLDRSSVVFLGNCHSVGQLRDDCHSGPRRPHWFGVGSWAVLGAMLGGIAA